MKSLSTFLSETFFCLGPIMARDAKRAAEGGREGGKERGQKVSNSWKREK